MNEKNEFWGIIELFGHTVMAGAISKSEMADFIQINVPECGSIPAWSKLINPKAIYGITPTTEEVARQKAVDLKSMPINRWDTEALLNNRFAELQEAGKIKMLETVSNHADDWTENDDLPI
ncbi:MAG: hypothetical protein AAF927_01745 [Bacteroidota bacterium]